MLEIFLDFKRHQVYRLLCAGYFNIVYNICGDSVLQKSRE